MSTDYENYPHHDQGITLAERLHVAVKHKPNMSLEHLIHFTGLLTETLVRKGILTEQEVVTLLDKTITGDTL